MLVSNFQVAKFYLQLCLAFSTFSSFLTCLLLLQPCNLTNIKISCRRNRSKILAPHLVTFPLLPCNCVPQNRPSYGRGLAMVWKCHFCKLLPLRCLLLRRNWKLSNGAPQYTLLFSYNSRKKIQVVQVIIRKPRPQWLSCRIFVSSQPRGATARRKHPQLPYQFVFQGQRTLQVRTVAGISLSGARVQQPLTAFQWHLIQKCQVLSQPQGHQNNGV